MEWQKILFRIHWTALLVITADYMGSFFVLTTLLPEISLGFKLLFYFSAVGLYFLKRKTKDGAIFYFGVFVWLPVVTLVSWVTLWVGLFLTMSYVWFFVPFSQVNSLGDLRIYVRNDSVLSDVHLTKVTETRYLIFEKTIFSQRMGSEERDRMSVLRKNGQILLKRKVWDADLERDKDTFLILKTD